MAGYYDYGALLNRAVKTRRLDDMAALGDWFEQYGRQFWNGEYFDADNGRKLYPIYELDKELDEYFVIGYEFR